VLRVQSGYASLRGNFHSQWGDSISRTRRLTARVQFDEAFAPAVSGSFGVDLARERADSTYITGDTGQMVPLTRRQVGYFGELRVRPSASWQVTAGVRADNIVRDAVPADPLAYQP
jgi:outer membrane receptor protein involved in Fe transport